MKEDLSFEINNSNIYMFFYFLIFILCTYYVSSFKKMAFNFVFLLSTNKEADIYKCLMYANVK